MATQAFKSWWATLSPEKRKTVIGVGCLVVLVGMVYLFVSAGPEKPDRRGRDAQADVNLLTGSDARTLGLESLGAELRDAQRNHHRLEGQVENLERDAATKKDLQQISGQLDSLSQVLNALKQEPNIRPQDIDLQHPSTPLRGGPAPQFPRSGGTATPAGGASAGSLLDSTMAPPRPAQPAAAVGGAPGEQIKVHVFGENDHPTAATDANHSDEIYLPAGSIISGVLLTGVDAPTGLQSKRDPIPALMRVKHEALLPNRFRADVRECFMIFGATGDLSTERALLRGETLSCVRHDGGVIEATVDAYAMGDDGKAGMRGRKVARNGSLVARAAFASFADALSQIFRPVAIQGLNTSPGTTTEFQAPPAGQALEASGYAGVGGAMKRLSEYFVGLADQMVPFIEIDAARPVEAVLLKGVLLKIRSSRT